MFRSTTHTRRLAPATGAAVLALAAAAALPVATADAQPGPPPARQYTAQQMHAFLEVFYGEHGPGAFARAYGVSPALAAKVRRTAGYDLLLCAQDRPGSIDIGRVTTAPGAATGRATVTTHWGRSGQNRATFTVHVGRDASRPIQLHDVTCKF